MLELGKIFNPKQLLFLTAFITLFLLECYFVVNNRGFLIFPRFSIIILILAYYFSFKIKYKNTYYLLYFICLLPINILFSFDDQSVLAMAILCLSRLLLLLLVLANISKLEKQITTIVLTLFTIIISLLLVINYRENSFFYTTILMSIILIVLLTITFSKLITEGIKNGNLELFLAMVGFMISDAVFGSKKLDEAVPTYLIFGSLLYYLSYILITFSVIKTSLLTQKSDI